MCIDYADTAKGIMVVNLQERRRRECKSFEGEVEVAKFCGKCGYPLNEAFGFCGNCGTNQRDAPSVATPAAVVNPTVGAAPAGLPPKSNGLVKVVLVLLAVLLLGGALTVGGLVYAAHKFSQKAHEYSAQSSGSEAGRPGDSSPNSKPRKDVCQLLTKEDVSQAIGMPIAATSSSNGACAYLVKGRSTDLTTKHMASLVGKRGADPRTQGRIEEIAGGFFKTVEADAKGATQDTNGNAVVLSVSVDSNSAAAQMKLNRRVLRGLSPDTITLEGVGDEAFDSAGSMMMVLKGDKLIRIMYMTCPCTVEAIKPLAQKLANAL